MTHVPKYVGSKVGASITVHLSALEYLKASFSRKNIFAILY